MDPFELDPTPDSPDEEANELMLKSDYDKYAQALEEEFELGVKYNNGTLTPIEIRTRTKEILTQGVPKAVATMVYLAQHSKSDGVRLNAAKYLIDKAIGKELDGLVGDPLENLMGVIHAEQGKQ